MQWQGEHFIAYPIRDRTGRWGQTGHRGLLRDRHGEVDEGFDPLLTQVRLHRITFWRQHWEEMVDVTGIALGRNGHRRVDEGGSVAGRELAPPCGPTRQKR